MYDKQFRFNEDGEFKILLFGDPHENDDVSSEKGKAKRADTLKFHKTALDALKPDLAVYMGDICAASRDDIGMESFKRQFERLIAPVVERKIPFATIMGNHDHDSGLEEEQTEIFVNTEYCVTRRRGYHGIFKLLHTHFRQERQAGVQSLVHGLEQYFL